MVYHPDRWQHATYHGISKTTRVERYRLLVLANAILSDPIKRKAYDEHGVGWDGGGYHGTPETEANRNANVDKEWRRQPPNVSMNSTWQEWEESRQQQGSQEQDIVLIHGKTSVFCLAILVFLGGCCLYIQAYYRAREIMRQRDMIHRALSEDLWRMKRQNECSSRDSLVGAFLSHRTGKYNSRSDVLVL